MMIKKQHLGKGRRVIQLGGVAVVLISILSCNSLNDNKSRIAIMECADNQELIDMFESDQADRTTANYTHEQINYNDSIREARVYELLEAGKVRTANDYNNAGLIFHHGEDSVAYAMAVKLLTKAIEMDSTVNKWLLACITDRYLLSIDKPQIYGTQYKRLENNVVVREELDTTIITDAERIEYGVETLDEQREKIKNLNKKKLTDLLEEGKSIDEIISIVKSEDGQATQYDLRETWFNHFGYNLLNEGKNEEALKIFKLNTELYPNGYNAFDSYGECLLLLDETEKAIMAFEKSLELNPENTNAKNILYELKN